MVRYNTDGGLAVAWDRRGARGDGRSLALAAGRSRVCSDAASRSGAGIQEVHELQRCRKSRVADVYVYNRWTAFFLLGQYACIRYSYYRTSVCILGLGTLASRAQFSRPTGTPQGRAWRQPTIHTRYKAQSKSTSAPNSHCNKQVTLATTLQYITTPKKRCNSIPLLASTRSSRCHKQVAIATQLKYITTPKKSCN